MFFALVLVGCGEEVPGGGGDTPGTTETDFEKSFNVIKEYVDNNIPYIITEDVELIEEYSELNAMIEWSSSNEDVLSFVGSATPDKSKAEEVTLSYKVMIGAEEKTGTKTVIVSPATIEQVLQRFERQFTSTITRDYNVKTSFYELFEVRWYSTDESLFDNNGKYYKPKNDTEFEISYYLKTNIKPK